MTNIQIEHNLKFTTATFGCFLRLPLSKKNLALATVLATMQNMASKAYPGISLQATSLEELYDMQVEAFPEVFGNQIIIFYSAGFVEPREILDPDYNYREIIKTFFNIVKNPLFDDTLLTVAKQQIDAEKNQYFDVPANYANTQFFNYWYRKTPQWTDTTFGDPEILQNCSLDDIEKFFSDLKNAPTICLGLAQDPDLVTDLMQEQLDWPGCSTDFICDHLAIPSHFQPFNKEEKRESNQAQLLVGYGYDFELPIKLRQFGGICLANYLAGDESSKLFIGVREKLGAAYSINALNYLNNSLFLITTGINKELVQETKAEIEKEVSTVAAGKIDKSLFKKAKEMTKRVYIISKDQPSAIVLQMLANALYGRNLTLEDRVKSVEKLTQNDLVKFGKALFLNESYCLG